MTEYLIFGFLIAILSLFSLYTKRRYKVALLLYIFALATFLIGCRYNVGSDWASYRDFYLLGYTPLTPTGGLEIGYTLWNKIVAFWGVPSGVYFAVTAFISLMIIYKAALIYRIDYACITFLIYYFLFLPSLQFNIVRTGLLGSCLLLSFAYKSISRIKLSLLWLAIGVSMHYMGLIFIPLWFIVGNILRRKTIIVSFLVAFIVYFIGAGRIINSYFSILFLLDGRASDYVNNADESYGFSFGLIFNILFYVYLLLTNREKYNSDYGFRILMNTLFISLLISISLSDLSIFVARLGQVLNLSLVILWPIFIRQLLLSSKYKQLKMIAVLLFLFIYLQSYFTKGFGLNDKDSETSAYPYKYNIEQLYKNVI